MTDLNRVVLIGRVTHDITSDNFGYVGQTAKMNLSVAVNRSVKKNDSWEDEVSFFEVQVWGKTAENLKQYISKGKQIGVEGSLIQNRWEKDGQKHSKVIINASSIQLLGGKADGNSSASTFTQKAEPSAEVPSGDFPESIPF